MKFTKEMVDQYANKLLFELTSEENKSVLDEFEVIDKTIDMINEIPGLSEVSPMTHALDDFTYTLTSDEAEESISITDALSNAPSVCDREIEIPKVVNKNDE